MIPFGQKHVILHSIKKKKNNLFFFFPKCLSGHYDCLIFLIKSCLNIFFLLIACTFSVPILSSPEFFQTFLLINLIKSQMAAMLSNLMVTLESSFLLTCHYLDTWSLPVMSHLLYFTTWDHKYLVSPWPRWPRCWLKFQFWIFLIYLNSECWINMGVRP